MVSGAEAECLIRAAPQKCHRGGAPVFLEWDRYKFTGGVEVPYRFNAGKNRRFLSASFMASHRINDIYSPDTLTFTYDKVQTLEYNLYFVTCAETSHRDLYPRTGQWVDLNFMHTPFNFYDAGYVAAAEAAIYFRDYSKTTTCGFMAATSTEAG
ncbi:MAG: hypothetical protein U5L09_08525 [Bacteroidales bacterium]|nr:hypothetical protein [Bacteroidales bacterium]